MQEGNANIEKLRLFFYVAQKKTKYLNLTAPFCECKLHFNSEFIPEKCVSIWEMLSLCVAGYMCMKTNQKFSSHYHFLHFIAFYGEKKRRMANHLLIISTIDRHNLRHRSKAYSMQTKSKSNKSFCRVHRIMQRVCVIFIGAQSTTISPSNRRMPCLSGEQPRIHSRIVCVRLRVYIYIGVNKVYDIHKISFEIIFTNHQYIGCKPAHVW